jgi:hypothetical protein
MSEEHDGKRLSTADMLRAGEGARTAAGNGDEAHSMPLLEEGDVRDVRTRWQDVQTRFVDDARNAVEEADSLVGEATKRIAETFAGERQSLEGQWTRGDNVSTEDLRVALTRYGSFFNRLLSA